MTVYLYSSHAPLVKLGDAIFCAPSGNSVRITTAPCLDYDGSAARIAHPFAGVHTSRGLQPGGIRLSLGWEDWHDIIGDLEDALQVV